MSDATNSKLLDEIILYAETYDGKATAVLTAKRFIVALIDVISDRTVIDIGDNEKRRLFYILKSFFPGDDGFMNIRKALTGSICEKETVSCSEVMYIKQRIYDAREAAKKNGNGYLEPELVLMHILNEPDPYLRSFISDPGERKEKTAEEDTLQDRLKRRFDNVFDESETGGSGSKMSAGKSSKAAVADLTEKVKDIYDKLGGSVYGQDNAISVFTAGYFQSELLSMTDKKRTRPKATFLFAGPPGVGKTFLSEKAAEILGLPYQRFDMSEYSDKEANIEFCGSDKVYKNGKEGNVTSFVSKNPECVILFDEMEKAHLNVIHLFLQILDAGRIRDNYTDEEVSFAGAILIFTTNAGKQLYENSESADFSGVTRKVILNALQKDINPVTQTPYFPAAICSRFASGNVVMFNHMTVHNLRQIAKKEIMRNAENFENEIGVKIETDEAVYTALLFAEGGSADARTIKNRAETFFNSELFELFRLIDSDGVKTGVEDLESVQIGVDLPTDNAELRELFEHGDPYEVLIFASKKSYNKAVDASPETKFINTQSVETAKKTLHTHDVSFVMIEMTANKSGDDKYLNIEDVDSKSRDLFWFVRETYPDMPVYLLQTQEKKLNTEEKLSFLRQGVRGVMTLSENGEEFSAGIRDINEQLHWQKSIQTLARANKLVSFETAQMIKNKGKTAQIRLFDFEMKTAIDAEDSKDILSNISKPDVSFEQVIGAEDAKKELEYFVQYLKNPKRYIGTGVSAPKGVLLYGPPGTGKTLLAKATASESDVTFIASEGNQFLKKYSGEGVERVHELFRAARKYAPSILFIDEVDAIAKERKGESNGAEDTLTAFLTEMDGFKNDTAKPVFVLAATNFDIEPGGPKSLDPAFVRRFDRQLFIDLPNRSERVRYIKTQTKDKPAFVITDEKIDNIAVRSTGMSLAGLKAVIELSLRSAVRNGELKVTDEIFEESFEVYNGGEAKKWDDSMLERIARHEAGHAFICWQSGETPSYVTIVARGGHGGYMQHGDNEDKPLYTKNEILARIRTALGGRAAEIVYYGEKDGVSTSASGDLAGATDYAQQIICSYGMSEDFGLAVIDRQALKEGELSMKVREAVNKILETELKNAVKLIEENRTSVDALVKRLMSENHLTGDEIKAVFEKDPGAGK